MTKCCIHLFTIISFFCTRHSMAFGVRNMAVCVEKNSYNQLVLFMNQDEGLDVQDDDSADIPIIAQSTVKIDDGGSDLTDRFKYKASIVIHSTAATIYGITI